MKNSTSNKRITIVVLAITFLAAGCGGTRVLKEPEPIGVTRSLASVSDEQISATLDWVIVRDGPGTWARNADWDQYMIRVKSLNDEPVQIMSITVVDSLGAEVAPGKDRKALIDGTKDAKRRYKDEGVRIRMGAGTGKLVAGAGAVAAGGAAAAMAAVGYGTAAGAATVGGILFVPVLAVGGVVRGVNNGKVNREIVSRHSELPIALQGDQEKHLDVFFPVSPSPQRIILTYSDTNGEKVISIDTDAALDGLHIGSAD